MDKPVAPYRRGLGKWASKIDFEAWQTYRAQLLAVTRDDII
jgi:Zn-dependent M16 (insulinase) family peptidase